MQAIHCPPQQAGYSFYRPQKDRMLSQPWAGYLGLNPRSWAQFWLQYSNLTTAPWGSLQGIHTCLHPNVCITVCWYISHCTSLWIQDHLKHSHSHAMEPLFLCCPLWLASLPVNHKPQHTLQLGRVCWLLASLLSRRHTCVQSLEKFLSFLNYGFPNILHHMSNGSWDIQFKNKICTLGFSAWSGRVTWLSLNAMHFFGGWGEEFAALP